MDKFWRGSLSLTALYAAVVIAMAAAISHYFQYRMVTEEFSRLVSSTGVLAFQTLALLVLSLLFGVNNERFSRWQQRLVALVALAFHLGLWLFVYTVWAGLFNLPVYMREVAPVGGQLLIFAWLALAALPWLRK
jgi:uncharacterized membrane protein YgdD (TMEM256/DUF423 family)